MTLKQYADHEVHPKRMVIDKDRNHLLMIRCMCLCTAAALIPIALVNLGLFYSSFIDNEAFLYSLHASSSAIEVNISSSSESEICDVAKGEWVTDSRRSQLYTNETCQYIQGHQNCMRNGRPDTGFLYWRWQPDECDLPSFNPLVFLNLMRNKKMMFFGDSIARNHMQSLLCAISQVEKPVNLYRDPIDKDVIWLFQNYNFTLSIFWSPFLVSHSQRVEDDGVTLMHIHLDSPEEVWKDRLSEYDVTILSTGPWYFKASIYYTNNQVIGCHHCPQEMNLTQVGFTYAYQTALEKVLGFMTRHESYKGTTFLRTFSMEHFENGEWWNGGTCNRTVPFERSANLTLPWMASEMHRIQVDEFSRASVSSSAKLKLLDVTYSAFMRPDGHPGVFRSLESQKQSDCLHWCLPGPIDTWNELLLQMLTA